jgi:hypothetical protein
MNPLETTLVNGQTNEMIKMNVLPQIVNYINKQHKLAITVQELEDVLLLRQVNYTPTVTKKRKKHILNKEGKSCQWEFKRGDTKNTFCGKVAIEGSDYCAACSKRKVVVQSQTSTKNNTKNFSIESLPKSSESDYRIIDAHVIDEKRNLVHNRMHNFIIHVNGPVFHVVGTGDPLDNKVLKKLTEEDIVRCNEIGYPYNEKYVY